MGKCGCKCKEKDKKEEEEIYNEEYIKKLEEKFKNENINLNESIESNSIELNNKNNENNELYDNEYGIDLNEPLIEEFQYDNFITNENNNDSNVKNDTNNNFKSQKNFINTSHSNKLNSEVDGGISSPNILNNNSIKHLKKKGVKQNTLQLFNISKKNTFNKENNNKDNNNDKVFIRKVITQSQKNNVSKNEMIEGINNLNDIFKNQRNNINYELNDEWKKLDITNFISSQKLNSIKSDEILFSSNINKLLLSSLFKNCSMNIEEFLILIKDKLLIYQNKENYILMKKPQKEFNLNTINYCERVNLTLLNYPFLTNNFYMYIEVNEGNDNDNKNVNNDILYNIIQKEQQGKFFVFFLKINYLLINGFMQ